MQTIRLSAPTWIIQTAELRHWFWFATRSEFACSDRAVAFWKKKNTMKWVSEWVNEWMNGWMNEWMNERMHFFFLLVARSNPKLLCASSWTNSTTFATRIWCSSGAGWIPPWTTPTSARSSTASARPTCSNTSNCSRSCRRWMTLDLNSGLKRSNTLVMISAG